MLEIMQAKDRSTMAPTLCADVDISGQGAVQSRPKSAKANADLNQAAKRISPVSGPPPCSNVSSRRSPVMNERSGGVGGGMGVGAFEARGPAGAKQKRSTLAQGSATAGRRTAGGGYGGISISAHGTPRTQYSEAVTPRDRGALHTPNVTWNPNYGSEQKTAAGIGLRHHAGTNAVKAGGIGYDVGPDPLVGDGGVGSVGTASARQRRHQTLLGARRSVGTAGGTSLLGTTVLEAGGISFNNTSTDWAARSEAGGSVEQQRSAITHAIGLLENSQLLQQDPVLRDIVQIIGNRLSLNHVNAQQSSNPPQRVVVTSDSGTQVNSVETGTQTDGNLGQFKEKRIRPLAKGKLRRGFGDGQNCSLSDSDVPSDQTETVDSQGGHRRRNSLDDISLSTNSPRESCDSYSRDASEASGSVSVASLQQVGCASVASSTDASQTGTLAHDQLTPQQMKRVPGDSEHGIQGVEDASLKGGIDPWGRGCGGGWRGALVAEGAVGGGNEIATQYGSMDAEAAGSQEASVPFLQAVKGKGSPLMSPLQALNANLNHYIGTYQHELEGINELGHSPDGSSLSPTFLAMSPSPSIETLKELKRILDHHYAKIFHRYPAIAHSINSPATAEMQRLTMDSRLLGEGDGPRVPDTEQETSPDRPPNPDPTKMSPGVIQHTSAPPTAPGAATEGSSLGIPRNVRMGNSPPKHKNVKMPLTQLRTVPTLNLPWAKRPDSGTSMESPLSTPRSGSAFLAHINSARSSANSGSATSTPRLPQGVIRVDGP